jgi:hypothetical protein
LAALLGTSDENAQRFLVCPVALHDVGKFSRDFQAKCPDLWAETAGPQLGDWRPSPPMSRHDQDGYAVRELLGLRELLRPATEGWSATTFNSLWAAVAGHHGQPRTRKMGGRNDAAGALMRNVGAAPERFKILRFGVGIAHRSTNVEGCTALDGRAIGG